MGWATRVERLKKLISCRTRAGKPARNRSSGRDRLWWEDNIKIIWESVCEVVDWIKLAQNRTSSEPRCTR